MKRIPALFATTLLMALPRLAHACSVCFSGASKGMERGFFWGILLLLALTFLSIAFFTTVVIRAGRRARPQ